MRVVTVNATSGADGILHLDVPVELPDEQYEVAIVLAVKPETSAAPDDSPESRGWSKDFLENVIGSIDDDTFIRHPQGELPPARTWE